MGSFFCIVGGQEIGKKVDTPYQIILWLSMRRTLIFLVRNFYEVGSGLPV